MLVLMRKRDEKILIGEDVVVTVVSIRGNKVKLGIEAPMTMPVHRAEVRRAIESEGDGRTLTRAQETRLAESEVTDGSG